MKPVGCRHGCTVAQQIPYSAHDKGPLDEHTRKLVSCTSAELCGLTMTSKFLPVKRVCRLMPTASHDYTRSRHLRPHAVALRLTNARWYGCLCAPEPRT